MPGGPWHSAEELQMLEYQTAFADVVRFTFSDVNGIARTKLIPKQRVADTIRAGSGLPDCILALGPRAEYPAIDHFEKSGYQNAVLVCCPGTVSKVQWSKSSDKYQVAQVLCEVYWPDGTVQDACPRYVARKQVAKLKEHGWSIKTGYECEFVLMDEKTLKPAFDGPDFLVQAIAHKFESLYLDMNGFLSAVGIQGECFEVEYGAGQFEVPLVPSFGVKAADDVFVFKQAVKEYCSNLGYIATFMSLASEEVSSTGTHLNHSLWDDATGESVFYSAGGKYALSDVGRHWLGGLVAHLPALTALCSPTVNCYHRVGSSVFSPKLANWGIDNRMCSIRLRNRSPAGTCVENRMPSGASNPYITLAATIAAGLDGVENKIEPPEKQGDKGAQALPTKLSTALDALEKDKVLCEALGAEFIRWFVAAKREQEVKKLEAPNSTFEMQQKEYMEFL